MSETASQLANLRRKYLQLLLLHPYAEESKDIETHLWIQTSHQFIANYKQRLTALDRAISSSSRGGHHPQQQQRHGGPGPVEHRKLLQRFRQYLAEEEKFWAQLVVRFRQSFGLSEAHSALVVLGILPEPENPPTSPTRNNHFQFPLEDPTRDVLPTTEAQRQAQLAILSKALVRLGDIARYKELYNEGGGRPRAGHEDGPVAVPPKRGGARGGRRGGAPLELPPGRERNYEKAQKCYEQARALFPEEGNPSHQLAILATYKKDIFGSLVHYYRALCVEQPYDMASENMGTVFNKAIDQWRRNESETDDGRNEPRHKVKAFKDKVVILHGLWRYGIETMELVSPGHAEGVVYDFESLLSERILPTETIRDVVMLSEGALWKHRYIRDPPLDRKWLASSDSTPVFSASAVESHMATHILALHRALLFVGINELAEKPEDVQKGDLAQKITAKFRRMLPALRVAGKWLRANLKYVIQGQEAKELRDQQQQYANRVERGREQSSGGLAVPIGEVDSFWAHYAQFSTALAGTFPMEKLPRLVAPLDEDKDLDGFLPLKKYLTSKGRAASQSAGVQDPVMGHPNDELLMRISDILEDTQAITESKGSPIVAHNNQFRLKDDRIPYGVTMFLPPQVAEAPQPLHPLPSFPLSLPLAMLRHRDVDEETTTETSRTDDDPVREAGNAFLDGLGESDSQIDELDDDVDEIVWHPRVDRPPISPIGPRRASIPSPPATSQAASPVRTSLSPRGSVPIPPTRLPASNIPIGTPRSISNPVGTTAQDLLNNVMGIPRIPSGGDISRILQQESTTPQAQLLFGSGPPSASTHSIWSTALDNPASRTNIQPPPTMNANPSPPSIPYYQTGPHHHGHSLSVDQGYAQPSLSSFHQPTPSYTDQLFNPTPSSSYSPQVSSLIGGMHHRGGSLTSSQLFGNDRGGRGYDALGLGYDSPVDIPLAHSIMPLSDAAFMPTSASLSHDLREMHLAERDRSPFDHRGGLQGYPSSYSSRPVPQQWGHT
ncbi:hypothetical protein JAAARDRAFT_413501 [Jaapia argillacea MUCL 33604]|uniref:DNA/RNA-binding domain-containing protein n=1 Tax=Jaapia argillacea MUCL 33604 TaxID=933084 RepID=A0A067PJZ4_9AGAM|nr:hypothetical protein JAAARDRAFT_413501 [Jaapia argillacea MUCL 33604]